MKNLISLIIRYHAFLLFVLLEFICGAFIFSHNNYQRASIINSSNAVSGDLFTMLNNIDEYFGLKSVNDSLVEENAYLRSLIMNYEMNDSARFQRTSDTSKSAYDILTAKVLSNNITLLDNHFLLNKGMVNGVSKMMGVITDQGVIGIVKDVSHNYGHCVSILSTHLEISAKLKSNNHFGYVQWDGKDPHELELLNIFNYVDVKVGDTVVTSGHSTIFPENVMIGTVTEFENDPSNGMYIIRLRLAANLKEANYVYVVHNKNKQEIFSLHNSEE